MQPPYNYPHQQPPGHRGSGLALALIAIGLILMIIAVVLAYLEYVNAAPLVRYLGSNTSINGVLNLIGYVTYKSVFIVIIAWVGSMIMARGVQTYAGQGH
ncbi:hypothetical protein [Caldivirga sp. UBA161]|uniref:hypothetical protein n=1 Tax=Caldivirga sp. UBA161 TaxID=1915569 RepID=UPI0025B9655A|nr:hypothetical protein [Caldivirga sp. UBA161]